ncbi:MAG TPA: FAD-dependent oxidoreductase [Candidatus Elarobacter sp.]|jgi:dihydrolipoamide dehydrogenase|nr:FAD-dependent oxidoreductase [Candidatus Elarobacter sp.]
MRYDLAVIGSGQGGVPLAIAFAKRGKRVVLFERGQLGGTCVNVGCTPSKAFLASAHNAARARRASDVHVHCEVRPDVPAVMARVREIVGEWHDGIEPKFQASSVELVRADASFEAPHVLRAGGETYEADVVVIDTGARANVPPIDGLAGTPYLTNENFFLQETLPRKLIVLGSGYIGLELGQGAARLGSEVTFVTPDDRIVAREETDVCSVLTKSFERDGIAVMLEHKATKIAHDGETFTVTLDDGTSLNGDGLLVAIGRVPNIPPGTTDKAGIALDERGFLKCDEHLRTSVAGHYGLGDVAGQPQFTHVSWEDYRRLDAIIGGDLSRTRDDRVLAYAMFTEPQVARVGLSADQAQLRGIAHRTATLPLSDVARGPEWSLEDGFFRLVVDPKSDEILGATFTGYEAGELIHVILAHMEAGSTWRVLERSVHIHPTFAEGLPSLARLLL